MKNPICISKSSHCDLNLIGIYGNYLFYFHFNPCPLGTDNGLVVGTDKIIISLKINLYSKKKSELRRFKENPETCFGSNSLRIPFSEANFFLNERYFSRLYLEVGRGSFAFLNHEKFHNNLNKSCKVCNLKELQFNRDGLFENMHLSSATVLTSGTNQNQQQE